MSEADFQKLIWLSSVPLVQLNDQRLPQGIASGCLIDYFGKRLLLTVSHAAGNQKNWAIQLRYAPSKGTEVYQVGGMNFLAKASLPSFQLQEIDFAYAEVSSTTCAYRQEIDELTNTVKSQQPITIHHPTLEDIPQPNDQFGFCGTVLPTIEKHFDQTYLSGELRIYSGLKFLRTEGDYHVFSLPFQHPGHKYFKGCSGAPILNSAGSIVALVCSGNDQSDEIWGISVKAYKLPIDILVGKFN